MLVAFFLCPFLKNFHLHTVKTPDFVSISEGQKFPYSDSEEQNSFFI